MSAPTGLPALRRWWPQPLIGGVTATLGLLALLAAWRGAFAAGTAALTTRDLLVALCLAGATITAYHFPLPIRPKTKIYLASAPLYLLVVLVAPPLAATAGALATLLGELSVRRARQTRAGDTASEVGRRILVLLLGAAVAHLFAAALHPLLALVAVAVVLEGGDIVTAPLVLAPITGEPPLGVIVTVARAAWLDEGAQYLLGLVGALAAAQALWAPLLLVGPIALVYYALTRALEAQAQAERARQEAEAARAQAVDAADALQHQALHDALTGLPNRTLLHDRLAHTLHLVERDASSLALLLLDLDRFKVVNDTLGHQAGDALLQQVAARMRDAVRSSDTVARLGGDEFALLLPGADRAGAVRVTQTLLAALVAPVTLEGQTVHVGASVGITLAPAQGREAAALLRQADVAMYVAKRAGSGYAVYDPRHDGYSAGRLMREAELRQALATNELVLHYQPTVDLRSGRATGVEALVRWAHPTHGLLAPDQFIPLAEQTGLIVPLTRWVLDQALAQGAAWARAGRPLAVAVNLSVRTLHDERLPDTLAWLLRRYAITPERVMLEITESVLMADPAQALTVLTRLSALGVRVAIDDFGTGYSSLAYLKQLPVDAVKIDKSFVQSMGTTEATKDTAIVRSIIELGHNLGLMVVAEGVEDAGAWARVRALGGDVAQGYYMSRPLPAPSLDRWLESSPWAPRVAGLADISAPPRGERRGDVDAP